jgi:hypothetical protein
MICESHACQDSPHKCETGEAAGNRIVGLNLIFKIDKPLFWIVVRASNPWRKASGRRHSSVKRTASYVDYSSGFSGCDCLLSRVASRQFYRGGWRGRLGINLAAR